MAAEHAQYNDRFARGLELMWGEGFMAPGGTGEIRRILDGIDTAGKSVLELGSGLGGPACSLVEGLGAGRVVGIDIEPLNQPKAAGRAADRGLSDRVSFVTADACALPCEDKSFDIVFGGGGVFCEARDKQAALGEALRVLRPGGWFAINDWFHGGEPFGAEFRTWIGSEALLDFAMITVGAMRGLMQAAGFADIAVRDRCDWYRVEARREVERMAGADRPRFEALLGREETERWIAGTNLKAVAVAAGDLRPHHLRARKPA